LFDEFAGRDNEQRIIKSLLKNLLTKWKTGLTVRPEPVEGSLSKEAC
jgi:hypothetical protein